MVEEENESETEEPQKCQRPSSSGAESGNSTGPSTVSDILSAPPAPTLSMVTKHSNGTLNLWQLTFADKSKFSQVTSN